MKFPINVKTLESDPVDSPKKFGMNASSSSAPKIGPSAPTPTPQLRFLSSQLVISGQPESPPKLYPRKGLTNPWARAGTAVDMTINSVRNRVEIEILAIGDIARSPRARRRCKSRGIIPDGQRSRVKGQESKVKSQRSGQRSTGRRYKCQIRG